MPMEHRNCQSDQISYGTLYLPYGALILYYGALVISYS